MITKDLVVLSRFLAEVDGVCFDSLEGRIGFQKMVYLLQAAGIDLGYRFDWDVYGPYSRGLASNSVEYEAERERIDEIAERARLTEPARIACAKVKKAIEKPEAASRLTRTGWMELMCSLHFISEALKIDLSDTDSLASELTKRKPFFADHKREMEAAFKALREIVAA